jgi:RNA polymerase sigma factor (sigma-70 family)
MSSTSRGDLRRLLTHDYDDLQRALTRRLKSAELAGDALQETFVELSGGTDLPTVQRPKSYVFRMAINIALRKIRSEKRTVSLADAIAAFDIADDAPDPQRAIEAKTELEALQHAVSELTPRRRAILHAARVEGKSLRVIADEIGISQRMVEIELKNALAHCALRLNRKIVQRFGPRFPSSSGGASED